MDMVEEDIAATCRVSEVTTLGNHLEPILVNFEHAPLKSSQAPFLKAAAFVHKDDKIKSRKRRIVAVAIDGMTYVSRPNRTFPDSSLNRTFLAFRNKETNQMKLVEVSSSQLSPHIEREEPVVARETDGAETYSEKMSTFVKSFGSKTGKRKYEQAEQYKVDVQDMKADLEEAISKADVKPEDVPCTLQPQEQLQSLLPPCNRNATSVEEVYKLSDILTEEDLAALEGGAIWMANMDSEEMNEAKESLGLSEFFIPALLHLKGLTDKHKSQLYMKVLIYVECLIRLAISRYDQLKKKTAPLGTDFPEAITNKALDMFTEIGVKNSRTRSPVMKDKNICYILVLALIIGDYTVDLSYFVSSLKMNMTKLVKLAKVVGATVSSNVNTGQQVAHLKLPLSAPPVEARPARKKK